LTCVILLMCIYALYTISSPLWQDCSFYSNCWIVVPPPNEPTIQQITNDIATKRIVIASQRLATPEQSNAFGYHVWYLQSQPIRNEQLSDVKMIYWNKVIGEDPTHGEVSIKAEFTVETLDGKKLNGDVFMWYLPDSKGHLVVRDPHIPVELINLREIQ